MAKKKVAPKKKAAPKKSKKTAAAPKKSAPVKKSAAPKKSATPVAKVAAPKSTTNLSKVLSPLDNRVLVDVTPGEQMTAGGLYIPASVTQSSTRGKVVAVGRGRRDKKGKVLAMDVSVGDEVVWADYAGTKVTIADREVLILREDEILGIVN